MLAGALLLTLGTGLFVASEFALVNIERSDVQARFDAGDKKVRNSWRAIKKTSTHLSAAQLGITITTILTGFLAEPALGRMLSPWLESLGLEPPTVSALSLVLAMAIATLTSFLIGELVPKNMALAAPFRVLRWIAPFQIAFTWTFGILIRFLQGNGNFLVRKLGVEPKEELSSARSAEELAALVRRSAELGSLERETAELLTNMLELSTLVAADIITPRNKLHALERNATANDLLQLAKTTGHSRFPVMGEDIDDIVGMVHLKRAMSVPAERRSQVPVSALMVEPLRVPETMQLASLIVELRGKSLQVAVVIDEYGGTAGLVTLEDAIEELVGELSDEHDRPSLGIQRFGDGSILFSGMSRPDELAEFGVQVSEDADYDTMSGFVMSELGRIPEVGDSLELENGTLRVERMDGRRVDRVRFISKPVSDD
jgi:CBS domain containing-hemolysin-like protein